MALAGGGIAMLTAARNAPVHQFTPVPGVAPDGSPTDGSPSDASSPDSAPVAPPAPQKLPDDIQWRSNFGGALSEARSSGKPVMVDFYTDWCGFCKKMDAEVYTDIGVIAESVNFVSVKVNAEKSSALAAKYQVSEFPTIIWLGADGTLLERLPGYADAPEFLKIMRDTRAKLPDSAV